MGVTLTTTRRVGTGRIRLTHPDQSEAAIEVTGLDQEESDASGKRGQDARWRFRRYDTSGRCTDPQSPAMRRVRERGARLPHLAPISRMVTLAQLAASMAHEVNPTITASVVDGKETKSRNRRAPAVAVPSLFEDGG